ncbi:PorV/PorQ family protein [bacterium]|nr:PorV/PorQ family protein [bacterium]
MNRVLILFAANCLLALPVFAGTGEAGFAFLKIGIGGRAAGMGEATVASVTDATATYWNPAMLTVTPLNSIVFTHNRWIEDVTHNFFAAKFASGRHAFGVHYISTGVDGIEQREIPSEEPTALFSSHDLAIGFSYAYQISERSSAGLTTKYIYERIQNSVHAWAVDAGFTHWVSLGERNLRLALVIANIGASGDLSSQSVILPATMRLGSQYEILVNSKYQWNVAMDIVKPIKESWRLNAGTEFGFNSITFLRAGYQFGYKTRGVSAGLGLKAFDKIRIDYGFTSFSHALGSAHRISASFEF